MRSFRVHGPIMQTGQSRLCLTRLIRNYPASQPGEVRGRKLSISICFKPQDLWIGAFWKREHFDLFIWICLIPCVPIRLHFQRTYGGFYG